MLSPSSPYDFMGLPTPSRSARTTSASIGIPELADSDLTIFGAQDMAQDFSRFGQRKLSHNPAPFSSLSHLPLLRKAHRTTY